MDYFLLAKVLEQRNHYYKLIQKLESDIDFKNAVLENDLDIKEEDREFFLDHLIKGLEELLTRYEESIDKIVKD